MVRRAFALKAHAIVPRQSDRSVMEDFITEPSVRLRRFRWQGLLPLARLPVVVSVAAGSADPPRVRAGRGLDLAEERLS